MIASLEVQNTYNINSHNKNVLYWKIMALVHTDRFQYVGAWEYYAALAHLAIAQ